jgi:homoserine kinase
MRAALPAEVPRLDAVFNVGRAALSVAAIASGHYEYLRASTEDRLHQPYQSKPYPEFPELIRAALDAGAIGACLSGSGSTVIAFSDHPQALDAVAAAFVATADRLDLPGSARVLAPRNAGAIVVETR